MFHFLAVFKMYLQYYTFNNRKNTKTFQKHNLRYHDYLNNLHVSLFLKCPVWILAKETIERKANFIMKST